MDMKANVPSESAQDLLSQISARSTAAMEICYKRCASAVHAFAHRRMGHAAQANVVVDDTLHQVCLSAGKFAAQSSAMPDHDNAVAAIMAAKGNGFECLAQGTSLGAAGVVREVPPDINATNTLLVAQSLATVAASVAQSVAAQAAEQPAATTEFGCG
jgi:hypothetical protein